MCTKYYYICSIRIILLLIIKKLHMPTSKTKLKATPKKKVVAKKIAPARKVIKAKEALVVPLGNKSYWPPKKNVKGYYYIVFAGNKDGVIHMPPPQVAPQPIPITPNANGSFNIG
jgi:hypothetical protein